MGFIWFHVILWKMVHTPNWQSRWQSDPDGVKDVWGLVSLHQKEPRWLLHPSANGVRCQLKKMVMACHGNGSYWRRGQKERAIAIKDFYLKILCRGFKGSVHLYAGFLKWGYPKIIQSSKILYYWLYIYMCVCVYIYIYIWENQWFGAPTFSHPLICLFLDRGDGARGRSWWGRNRGHWERWVWRLWGRRLRERTDYDGLVDFNMFQHLSTKSPRGNMNIDINLDMIDLSNTYRYSWGI